MYLVACHLFCACRRYITYTLAADRVYHFHKGDWKLFKSHVESTTQNIAKKKMRLDTFPDHAVNTIKSRRACGLFIFEEKDLMTETDRQRETCQTSMGMACASPSKGKGQEEPGNHLSGKERKKNIGQIVQKELKAEKNGACSATREGAIF